MRKVLDGRHSFEDALDCVHISRIHQRWDLVRESAAAALSSIGNRHVSADSIEEAALYLAKSFIKDATSLEELAPLIKSSITTLRRLIAGKNSLLQSATSNVNDLVAEIAVLLTNDETASYVALCSRLRKLERPDLAQAAATVALSREPRNPKALTTRGAAAIDAFNLPAAEVDLKQAWKIGESSYVANAVSRLRLTQRRNDDALQWAEKAVGLDPGRASWATMAAAARASEDTGGFENAIRHLNGDASDQLSLFDDGYSHRWPLYLSGLTLVRAGRLDEAKVIATELEALDYGPAKKLFFEIRAAERR